MSDQATSPFSGGSSDQVLFPLSVTVADALELVRVNSGGNGFEASGFTIIDDDTMATASAVTIPTSESVVAYVTTQLATVNSLAEILALSNTTGGTNLVVTAGDQITTDTIVETTTNAGVTVESVVLKDGLVSGRNVATDGTKLDGIEANADVTDVTNVTAAGALMDSEVDANIKTLVLPASTTISSFGATLTDDASAAAAATTLGLGTSDNVEFNQITSSGHMAVAGATVQSWPTAYKAIDGPSSSVMFDNTQGDSHIGLVSNAYWDGSNWRYRATGTAAYVRVANGEIKLRQAASGTGGNNITWTDALSFDTSFNATLAADFILGKASAPTIRRDVSNSGLSLAGGNSSTDGLNMTLYGPADSDANDWRVRAGTTEILRYDHSQSRFDFSKDIEALGLYLGGSVAANHLDDYEEGTWTPVGADAVSGGNEASTTSSTGTYTKIGRLVYVTFVLDGIDTTGLTGGNDFHITGLPFATAAGTPLASGGVTLENVSFTGFVNVRAINSNLSLWETASGAADDRIMVSQLTSSTAKVQGYAFYIVS